MTSPPPGAALRRFAFPRPAGLARSAHARRVYGRLLGYVRPYWRMFALALAGMLAYAATEPAFAALMKPIVDGGLVERTPESLRFAALALVAVFLLRGAASFASAYALSWVGRRVVADLRQAMMEHLLAAPAAWYDRHGSGQLLARLTYNVENVASAATKALTVLVRDSFSVIGLTAYMLYVSASLTLVLLAIVPPAALAVRFAAGRYRRYGRRIQERVGHLTHTAQQAIEAHRVVKTFGGAEAERERFHAVNEKTRSLQMKLIATESAAVPFVQLVVAAAIGVVVYLSSLQGLREEITVGAFLSFVVALGLLLPPVKRLTEVSASLQRGIVAAESVFELLDTAPERDAGTRRLARAAGRVEFRQVTHSYSADADPALIDFSLSLAPGESVALLGPSGSGKSTVASLLLRFYDPEAGEILLDGIPIRELTLASLRAQIALVSQDVMLFNDTVAANIAYGRPEPPTPLELARVAVAAHALDFIRALPQGFETPIGDRGVLLSGGQRQRLAIARAMLKDAPILILDEATSALDTESERHIQAALAALMAGRTTLTVAHRLSTIARSDRILVLDRGRVMEEGPPAALAATGGWYARVLAMQSGAGGEGGAPGPVPRDL